MSLSLIEFRQALKYAAITFLEESKTDKFVRQFLDWMVGNNHD